MYKVYWTFSHVKYTPMVVQNWLNRTGEDLSADAIEHKNHSVTFDSSDMDSALILMNELRQCRKSGQAISFIGMVSENPDLVGESGVDEVSNGMCPDGEPYTWKKRRI